MSLTRMDISTFEQNLVGLRGGGKLLLAEYTQLTRERDELREALTFLADRFESFDGAVHFTRTDRNALQMARKRLANLSREIK